MKYLILLLSIAYIIFEISFRKEIIFIASKFPTIEELENIENLGRILSSFGFALFINTFFNKNKKLIFAYSFAIFFVFQLSVIKMATEFSTLEAKETAFALNNFKGSLYGQTDYKNLTYFERTYVSLIPFVFYGNSKIEDVKANINSFIADNAKENVKENLDFYYEKYNKETLSMATSVFYEYEKMGILKKRMNERIEKEHKEFYKQIIKYENEQFENYVKHVYGVMKSENLIKSKKVLFLKNDGSIESNGFGLILDKQSGLMKLYSKLNGVIDANKLNDHNTVNVFKENQNVFCKKLNNETYDCDFTKNNFSKFKSMAYEAIYNSIEWYTGKRKEMFRTEYAEHLFPLTKNYIYSFQVDLDMDKRSELNERTLKAAMFKSVDSRLRENIVKEISKKGFDEKTAKEKVQSLKSGMKLDDFLNQEFVKNFMLKDYNSFLYDSNGYVRDKYVFEEKFSKFMEEKMKKDFQEKNIDVLNEHIKSLIIVPFAVFMSSIMILFNIFALAKNVKFQKSKIAIMIAAVALIMFMPNKYDKVGYYDRLKNDNGVNYVNLAVVKFMQNTSVILNFLHDSKITIVSDEIILFYNQKDKMVDSIIDDMSRY